MRTSRRGSGDLVEAALVPAAGEVGDGMGGGRVSGSGVEAMVDLVELEDEWERWK